MPVFVTDYSSCIEIGFANFYLIGFEVDLDYGINF